MSDLKNAHGILDVVRSISSNRESGQLEISSSRNRGTLLFSKGKLVSAKLGTLTGFQAVNAAVSLRDVQFSFNPLTSPPPPGAIALHERIVLKQFFGIETAEMYGTDDGVEPPIDWNITPHQVLPLAEDAVDQNDLLDTPTVEVKPVVVPVLEEPLAERAFVRSETIGGNSGQPEQQFVAGEATAKRQARDKAQPTSIINAQGFQLLPRLPIVVSLMLVLVLAAAATALIPKLKARRESASRAPTAAEQSSAIPESTTPDVKKESLPDSRQQVEQVVSNAQSTAVAQQQSPRVRSGAPSLDVAAGQRDESAQRDPNVQDDLTGEWKVINTVEQTRYKAFKNMRIGFRLIIEQTGKDFTARGEKVSENGRNLPDSNRTPIRVIGSIDGDKVVATFIEDGMMRRTNGRFTWTLQNENAALTGTFISAAANSSGKSAAIRQP